MTGHDKTPGVSDRMMLFFVIAWVLAYFAARFGLEATSATAVRVSLALLPIPFFLALVKGALDLVARQDELFRRIHLEALAVAFPLMVTLLMVLGLFELAVGLNQNDWSYRHIWPFAVMFYYFGWSRAVRRYK